MTPKQTTINTVTLTCSTCGSAQFIKLDTNEYQCSHCQAVTLVEDNVAQRLEKILRGIQAPAQPKLPPVAIVAIGLTVIAIALLLAVSLFGRGASGPSRYSPPVIPPIDASLVKLTDVQNVRVRNRNQLVMVMRNETGEKIDSPRVTATFYQGELTLSSATGSPLARTLLPGEYTPVVITLPDTAYTRYTLEPSVPSRARSTAREIAADKVQLVRSDGAYRLVGLLRNAGSTAANSTQITVMLYGEDGKLIGTGTGYGSANSLVPGGVTSFDVSCDMLSEGKVGSYDYMVQSES